MHQFLATCHLTTACRKQYEGIYFKVPTQVEVEDIITQAKDRVRTGDCVNIPKALFPLRGRPVKNAAGRKRSWFESGPENAKKQSYSCGTSDMWDRTTPSSPYRQLFAGVRVPVEAREGAPAASV